MNRLPVITSYFEEKKNNNNCNQYCLDEVEILVASTDGNEISSISKQYISYLWGWKIYNFNWSQAIKLIALMYEHSVAYWPLGNHANLPTNMNDWIL